MRIRTSLAGVLLVAAALLASAPVAGAQEEGGEHADLTEEELIHAAEDLAQENGATEFEAHCIEEIVGGGSPEDCNEAPSPILPATDELFWGSITFVVLFVALWKFAYPAIKKGMEARSERIRADLAAAENQKEEAEQVLSDYRAQLADAKSEAGRIIEEARQTADALKRDSESRLQAELAEMRQRAMTDVENVKAQTVADLRGEIAQLAIGAAEVVVKRNLDHDAQLQLIEDYINQVGSPS